MIPFQILLDNPIFNPKRTLLLKYPQMAKYHTGIGVHLGAEIYWNSIYRALCENVYHTQ